MGLLDRLRGKKPEFGDRLGAFLESQETPSRPYAETVDARDESALPENAILLGGQGRVEVKGEENYQDALDRVCGGKCQEGHARKVLAILQPEPDNKYDSNAVRVTVDGEIVGYMNRKDAATYAPLFRLLTEKGKVGATRAFIRGGWRRPDGDEGHYGIELELSSLDVLMKSRKITSVTQP